MNRKPQIAQMAPNEMRNAECGVRNEEIHLSAFRTPHSALRTLLLWGLIVMASQGPLTAGTGADDATVGSVAWNSPANITASDDVRADVSLSVANQISHYAKATNFGFAIPSTATIDGIVVEWEIQASAVDKFVDSSSRIVKGGSISGDEKASATHWPTSDTFASYGGAADKWGLTWTPADINASTFGAVLAAQWLAAVAPNARIDSCRITVYYTPAASEGIIQICGFESQDLGEISLVQGTFSISTTVKRFGSASGRANPAGTGIGYGAVNRQGADGPNAAMNLPTCYVRFWFRWDLLQGAEEIFVAKDSGGAYKFSLQLTAANKIAAYDSAGTLLATGNTVLTTATWYRIDCNIGTGASAAWAVRISANVEISGTANLLANNTDNCVFGKVTNRNGAGVDFYYDDIAIADDAYPADGKISFLIPNAAGAINEWIGTYGQLVVVPHDGDATRVLYNISTLGASFLFQLQDTSLYAIKGTINAAKSLAVVRRTGAAGGTKLRLYSGGISYDTSSYAMSTQYVYVGKIYSTDPATGYPWTLNGLDNAQIGQAVSVLPSIGNDVRCTLAGLMVDEGPVVIPTTDLILLSDLMFSIAQAVVDSITFTDSAVVIGPQVSDPLVFLDSVGTDRKLSADEPLVLTDTWTMTRGLNPDSEPLVLIDTAGNIIVGSTETVTFTDTDKVSPFASSETLVLSDATPVIIQGAGTTELATFTDATPGISLTATAEPLVWTDIATFKSIPIVIDASFLTDSAAAPNAAIPVTDLTTATDTSKVGIPTVDSLVFTDTVLPSAKPQVVDLSVLTDTAPAPQGPIPVTDSLVFTDLSNVRLATVDLLTWSDVQSLAAKPIVLDQITEADTAVISAAAIPVTDLLTFTDASGNVRLATVDPLVFTDSVAFPTVTLLLVAQPLTLADVSSLTTQIPVTDSMVGSDVAAQRVPVPTTDSLVFTDVAATSAKLAGSNEPIVLLDVSGVGYAIPATDLITFTDLSGVKLQIVGTDPIVFTDSVIAPVVVVQIIDALTLTDVASQIILKTAEAETLTDVAAAPRAILDPVTDSLSFVEVGTITDTTLRMLMVSMLRVRPRLAGETRVRPS